MNLHFINEGVFHINTSQMADAYNASCSPDVMNRKMSLCGWTLLPQFPEVLIVPDLLQDVRYNDIDLLKYDCAQTLPEADSVGQAMLCASLQHAHCE